MRLFLNPNLPFLRTDELVRMQHDYIVNAAALEFPEYRKQVQKLLDARKRVILNADEIPLSALLHIIEPFQDQEPEVGFYSTIFSVTPVGFTEVLVDVYAALENSILGRLGIDMSAIDEPDTNWLEAYDEYCAYSDLSLIALGSRIQSFKIPGENEINYRAKFIDTLQLNEKFSWNRQHAILGQYALPLEATKFRGLGVEIFATSTPIHNGMNGQAIDYCLPEHYDVMAGSMTLTKIDQIKKNIRDYRELCNEGGRTF